MLSSTEIVALFGSASSVAPSRMLETTVTIQVRPSPPPEPPDPPDTLPATSLSLTSMKLHHGTGSCCLPRCSRGPSNPPIVGDFPLLHGPRGSAFHRRSSDVDSIVTGVAQFQPSPRISSDVNFCP
ncbi:hypothetical protein AALP_AAs48293U000100 [Arabis alpina]|uniref:Uncharacterized protein n=1 Tax=Arabis alpina TaxID=50452 RepID=A0A087FWM1_ARAAL|nr:hypothetical protein AALP_AAs48293U000100 [Arabis alpina]